MPNKQDEYIDTELRIIRKVDLGDLCSSLPGSSVPSKPQQVERSIPIPALLHVLS